jgi:hypothetical protein
MLRSGSRVIAAVAMVVTGLSMTTQAVITPASAQASPSANFIIEHCRETSTDPDRTTNLMGAFCMGQVTGLYDAGSFMVSSMRFCAPKGSTRHQAMRVVLAFLDANPHRLHEPFSALALEAMRKAWPCK